MIDFLLFLYFLTLHADRLAITVSGFTVRINNIIALCLFGYMVLRFRMLFFSFEKKLIQALLLVACSVFVSLFLSDYVQRCTIFSGWLGFTFLCYFFLPYFFFFFFDEKKILKLYFLSFLFVGLYAGIQLMLSFFGIHDPFAGQTFMGKFCRPNAFAFEPSYYALYMTPFVMTANLYYILQKRREFFIFKALNIKHIVLINFLYLVSTSTSAFFAYFIFLGCVFLALFSSSIKEFYPHLKKMAFKFGCLLVTLSIVFVLCFRNLATLFFMKFFFSGTGHHSFSERWQGIVAGFQIFKENIFFGVGLGAYPNYLYEQTLSEKIRYSIKPNLADMTNPLKAFEPMNVFTEVLACLGLFGMIAFAFLLFIYFSKAKAAITLKENENRDLCFSLLISMIVTFIVLQFNQGILRTYIWTHFALTFSYFLKIISAKGGDLIRFRNAHYLTNSAQN